MTMGLQDANQLASRLSLDLLLPGLESHLFGADDCGAVNGCITGNCHGCSNWGICVAQAVNAKTAVRCDEDSLHKQHID